MKMIFSHIAIVFLLFSSSCHQKTVVTAEQLRLDSIKINYWYNDEAEMSSYTLKQARYGQIHEGKAVMVFVTEPFSTVHNTKADKPTHRDTPVLKLNFTKKFNTGIYPYSMMTSTFFPFEKGKNSLKISSSSQEWCGHTYMELKNKGKFKVKVWSYFERETKGNISLEKSLLEDDIWSMIRLQPDKLPQGETKMIPSFFSLRLLHQDIKTYKCELATLKVDSVTNQYSINYPLLDRTLIIKYEAIFPYRILSWEETYISGWGENKKRLTTTGNLLKTIKSDYWAKHSNEDSDLRKQLELE